MPSIVLRLSQKKQILPVSSTSPNMDNHVARSGVGPARMKNTNAPTTTMTGSTAATGYHDDEGDDDDDAHLLVLRHQDEEKHGDAPSADDEERSKQKNQNIHVSSTTTTTTTSPRINPTSALPVSNRNTINNHTVHPTGVLVATDHMIDHAQNYEECLSNNAHSCTDATLSHHKLNDGEHEEDGDYSKGHDANSRKRGLVSTDSLFSSPPKKYFPRHSGGTAPAPRRQYAVQEKSASAASSVTSENAGTTNFNDNMDPRYSTTSSVPFPAASPSVSSSSSVHSTRGGIGASGYKNKHGTRRNSKLLSSQTRQPTGIVLPEENFQLRKSVSAAGQNLKGYRGGDNNQHIRSVGGDSCMENNEAVPSPYAAQYSSNQPPFFDMVQHHPYLVQPSSATNSFTLLPSGAAAVHHLPPNGFYYYSSDVSPQNVGAPQDPHHSRRNSNSNGVQSVYHGEGDVSRSGTQVVVLPNHQSNNGIVPLSADFNSAIPHTGANQNCQILYYVPHPSANTSAGPFVHDVSPSVGGYYVQMPSVANNHMVSPAPTMSHITNHVTGDSQRVYPGTQFPPPEYRLNHSYLPQQNHNEHNATYFHSTQHGSRTSQKTNFDQHFPNNHSHNDAKELANNQHHHKEAMDDGTAAGGGPFHQPDDFATRKRILLTKLEEEKPRRPLTAYNFFFSEERERIIAEMSSKNAEDDATNLDTISLSDSPSLKNSGSHPAPHSSPGAVVQTNEDNDDKMTQQEQTNINNGLEEMIRAKTEKLLSSRRQCDRPKRSHKKEHGKVSFQVLCTLVGKRWKALSDEQKQYYVDLSKKDIQRYRMDMKDYARKRARAVETFGVDDAIEK